MARKKQTLQDVSFADLIAMKNFAAELKHERRRNYDKWRTVQDKLLKEIHRRINRL